MLTPRARSAFICLRCEARIARHRPAAFLYPTTRAHFSTSAALGQHADNGETLRQTAPAQLRISKEKQPLNRLRLRKGKVIRETSTSLKGLKQLGDEADILVLKEVVSDAPDESDEPATVPKKANIKKPKKNAELVETPAFVAFLPQDSQPTQDEIHQRLESLRPATTATEDNPHYVPQTTFVKLMTLLLEGFTSAQLAAYYSSPTSVHEEEVFKHVVNKLQKEKRAKGFSESSITRSEWQPGTTAVHLRLPNLELNLSRLQTKAVNKQLLVNRILRHQWHLVPSEEVASPGELELYLKPWAIALLTTGENVATLEEIGKARRARIELIRKDCVLRVTADKNTTEYVARDVETTLKNLKTRLLRLKLWLPLLVKSKIPQDNKLVALYSQNDLDMISALSQTVIHAPSDNKFFIRGFTESAIDEAERNILKLLPLKDTTIYTCNTRELDMIKETAYLLPVSPKENCLDNTFRNSHLGRWSLPIAREPELQSGKGLNSDQSESTAGSHAKATRLSSQLVSQTVAAIKGPEMMDPKTNAANKTVRSPMPTCRLSAEIGQILCPLDQTRTDGAIDTIQPHPLQSPFLSDFPSLPSILTSLDSYNTTRMQQPTLIYDFIPATEQRKFKVGQLYPKLRVHMHTHFSGDGAKLHKCELTFQHRIHDVHLADELADIRFSQSMQVELQLSSPIVRKWASDIIQNIQSGERLYAPPLIIDVPKWTIPNYNSDGKGTRAITYLFSSVQFQQTLASQILGMNVEYSTVQAGKFGVSGGRLCAHYNANYKDHDKLLQDEDGLKKFVKACFAMVGKITTGAANTVPMSSVIAPRSDLGLENLFRASEGFSAHVKADSRFSTKTNLSDEVPILMKQNDYGSRSGAQPTEAKSKQEPSRPGRFFSLFKSTKAPSSHGQLPKEPESPFSEDASTKEPNRYDSRRGKAQPLKSTV